MASTVPTNNSPKELPKTTRKCGHCTNPIGKPLGHKSEELLHTKWIDKSGALKELTAQGVYPNSRHVKEFVASGYPYDEIGSGHCA